MSDQGIPEDDPGPSAGNGEDEGLPTRTHPTGTGTLELRRGPLVSGRYEFRAPKRKRHLIYQEAESAAPLLLSEFVFEQLRLKER